MQEIKSNRLFGTDEFYNALFRNMMIEATNYEARKSGSTVAPLKAEPFITDEMIDAIMYTNDIKYYKTFNYAALVDRENGKFGKNVDIKKIADKYADKEDEWKNKVLATVSYDEKDSDLFKELGDSGYVNYLDMRKIYGKELDSVVGKSVSDCFKEMAEEEKAKAEGKTLDNSDTDDDIEISGEGEAAFDAIISKDLYVPYKEIMAAWFMKKYGYKPAEAKAAAKIKYIEYMKEKYPVVYKDLYNVVYNDAPGKILYTLAKYNFYPANSEREDIISEIVLSVIDSLIISIVRFVTNSKYNSVGQRTSFLNAIITNRVKDFFKKNKHCIGKSIVSIHTKKDGEEEGELPLVGDEDVTTLEITTDNADRILAAFTRVFENPRDPEFTMAYVISKYLLIAIHGTNRFIPVNERDEETKKNGKAKEMYEIMQCKDSLMEVAEYIKEELLCFNIASESYIIEAMKPLYVRLYSKDKDGVYIGFKEPSKSYEQLIKSMSKIKTDLNGKTEKSNEK